jgi:hypothetical protein
MALVRIFSLHASVWCLVYLTPVGLPVGFVIPCLVAFPAKYAFPIILGDRAHTELASVLMGYIPVGEACVIRGYSGAWTVGIGVDLYPHLRPSLASVGLAWLPASRLGPLALPTLDSLEPELVRVNLNPCHVRPSLPRASYP